MQKSKLITYLRTFTKDELFSFQKFITSPYFNEKEALVKLFNILQKEYPDFEEASIEKKIVYGKLCPKVSFNEKHLGYLMSDLCKLIEKFFQIEKYDSNRYLKNYHLISSYKERNLKKHFQSENKKTIKSLNDEIKNDSELFLNKYLIYDEIAQMKIIEQKRRYDKSLEIADKSLDDFYILNKLKYACSMLNNQNIISHPYQIKFLEVVLNIIEDDQSFLNPCIEVFYLSTKMLRDEKDLSIFKALKNSLAAHLMAISKEDAKFIFAAAINYCARRIREGNKDFAEEALNLYLKGIDSQVFIEDGFLAPQNFKNIINLGLNFRSFDWVETFILNYYSKLPKEEQENALNYNLAFLNYSKKDYNQAVRYLNKIKFSDISYNFSTKELLMRIYYEEQEEEPLLSLIASFSLFLKRNKTVSRETKMPFINFCAILNRILRKNPKKVELIINEIKTSKFLTSRSWLYKIAMNWKAEITPKTT